MVFAEVRARVGGIKGVVRAGRRSRRSTNGSRFQNVLSAGTRIARASSVMVTRIGSNVSTRRVRRVTAV